MGATIVARLLGWRHYEREDSDEDSTSQSFCSIVSVSSTDSLINHSQAVAVSPVYKGGGGDTPINKLPMDLLLR